MKMFLISMLFTQLMFAQTVSVDLAKLGRSIFGF